MFLVELKQSEKIRLNIKTSPFGKQPGLVFLANECRKTQREIIPTDPVRGGDRRFAASTLQYP
jgi:hypothetical protein